MSLRDPGFGERLAVLCFPTLLLLSRMILDSTADLQVQISFSWKGEVASRFVLSLLSDQNS